MRGSIKGLFQSVQILPGAEDHVIRTLTMHSKVHWGVWGGSWAEGPALSKAQRPGQCVFDVATERVHGSGWREQMRLDLTGVLGGLLAPIQILGCLPARTLTLPLGFR